MHPLLENTSALKDSELENKIQSLSRKYFQTANPVLREQIVLMMDGYKEELSNRRAKFWQEQNEKRDTDLDNLINVS